MTGGPGERRLLAKAWRLLRQRPTALCAALRGYLLFVLTHALRRLLPPPGVIFGENVRLQRLASVMAEAPAARIEIGADSIIYEDSRLEAYGEGCISIGPGAVIGGARIACRSKVSIGSGALISWNVFIQDYDSHPLNAARRREQVAWIVKSFHPRFGRTSEVAAAAAPNWKPRAADIVSGDDVGSGANATVLKGVVLGRGCVVGAGAVVTRGEYPPDTVLAGNPARAVKTVGADLTVVTTAGVEAVQILPLPVMQSCAAETDTAPIESEAAQSAAAHALKTM